MKLKHSFFPAQTRFTFCISKYTKQQPLFLLLDRFIHSDREDGDESAGESPLVDYRFWRKDVPRLSSSDRQKFVDTMRGKLDVVYMEIYRKNIYRLVTYVAEKYLSHMKEDVEWKINNMASAKGNKGLMDELTKKERKKIRKGLMDDLLETKWLVSTGFLEERRKAEEERMKTFPHINDVEEMCRASDHQVGMERRDKLRGFVCNWTSILMLASDVPRLQPHFRGISFEKDATTKAEKKEVAPEDPHPSDPEWLQIANQVLHSSGDISKASVSDWYRTKASAYVKRRYPLRFFLVINKMLSPDFEGDSVPPLLAEWAELLHPNPNDWIALLYRLDNSHSWKYSEVAEHILDEESFQEANMRDCLDIIYLYYKYDDSDCENILNKMKDKGMLPDILFFALKAYVHSNAGKLDRAKEALDRAKDEFESLRNQVFQPDNKNCHVAGRRRIRPEL